jgi:hypothetical protein
VSDEYDTTREDCDPEVLADLQLRSATLAARGDRYTRPSPAALYVKPADAEFWKCRFPTCQERIGVVQDVVERLAIFNAYLATRGERAIPNDCILICAEHLRLANEERARRRTDRVARVIANVKRLRENPAGDPNALPDVIAELRRDHHPDVDGLIASLMARHLGNSGKAQRKRARL